MLSITLDPTFGVGGQAILGPPSGAIHPIPESISLQNGEIVQISTDVADLIVTRFLANGSVDTSFGSGGSVTIKTQLSFEQSYVSNGVVNYEPLFGPNSVLVNASGGLDIAAVGERSLPGHTTGLSLEVVQLRSDGSLDSRFGRQGVSYFEFSGKTLAAVAPTYMAFDPHGRLVVASQVNGLNVEPTVAVARFRRDGTVDKTFHHTGSTTITLPARIAQNGLFLLEGVLVQPDSKIVVSGPTVYGLDTVVVRLNANGVLDKSFNHTGIAAFNIAFGGLNSVDFSSGVALDGKNIVISGWTTAVLPSGYINSTIAGQALFVAELKPNGSVDSGFGGTGAVEVPFTQLGLTGTANIGGIITLPDGSIVVGGDGYEQGTDAQPAVVLVALTPSGGVSGLQTVTVGSSGPNFFGNIGATVVRQPDAKLVYWSDGLAVRFVASAL